MYFENGKVDRERQRRENMRVEEERMTSLLHLDPRKHTKLQVMARANEALSERNRDVEHLTKTCEDTQKQVNKCLTTLETSLQTTVSALVDLTKRVMSLEEENRLLRDSVKMQSGMEPAPENKNLRDELDEDMWFA